METATRLIEHGKDWISPQSGEDPATPQPLQLACCIGSIAMIVISALGLFNVFTLFTEPTTYLIQIYLLCFGVVGAVEETRFTAIIPYVDTIKSWLAVNCRIVSHPLGRGMYYIVIGTLGMSLWASCLFEAIVGSYMTILGVMSVLAYAAAVKRVEQFTNAESPPSENNFPSAHPIPPITPSYRDAPPYAVPVPGPYGAHVSYYPPQY